MTDTSSQDDAHYEQQWQSHLVYEQQTWLALDQKQQVEKEQAYLHEINTGERTQLLPRHETERKTLLQQHRSMRVALRKNQPH